MLVRGLAVGPFSPLLSPGTFRCFAPGDLEQTAHRVLKVGCRLGAFKVFSFAFHRFHYPTVVGILPDSSRIVIACSET